ncbi:MAG: putative toxin-antitoxin system toxin component, PIN family [Caldiserica bacterium]|nr:putative toxin-antitoxin system toxin component, PIN family [Caldisericota bacterium]
MRKVPKVVVDTNIFVSALLGSKPSRLILEAFVTGRVDLVISEALFRELMEVVGEDRLADFIKKEECEELAELLKTDAVWIKSEEKISACRDPKDNIVLESAVAGKVNFIVTGDNDLLVLSPFRNIPIVTPAKFLKLL